MIRKKVVPLTNLPARYPFGLAALLLWIGDKIDSTVYFTLLTLLMILIVAVVMFRQSTELEVNLKELSDDEEKNKGKENIKD